MTHFGDGAFTEVVKVERSHWSGPDPRDWGPYKKRAHGARAREDTGKGRQPHAQERSGGPAMQHLDLEHLAFCLWADECLLFKPQGPWAYRPSLEPSSQRNPMPGPSCPLATATSCPAPLAQGWKTRAVNTERSSSVQPGPGRHGAVAEPPGL